MFNWQDILDAFHQVLIVRDQKGQFYPDGIILAANVTDTKLQEAMDYLLSGEAQPGCKILLNDNHLSLAQIDILLKALADDRCPPRIEIFLDYCHLTNPHAEKFAKLFENGHYAADMRLHFFDNNIDDLGLLAMITALNRDVQRPGVFLNMQYNLALTNGCVETLTQFITDNKICDGFGINLQNNPALSRNVLEKCADSIEKNTAVTELSLDLVTIDILDAAMMDGDMPMYFAQEQKGRELAVKFCGQRNQLLQKYGDNPDYLHRIYSISKANGYPLPCPPKEKNLVPSLGFFASKSLPPDDLQAFLNRYPDGFESLKVMQNIANELDPDAKKRSCPWPCAIL